MLLRADIAGTRSVASVEAVHPATAAGDPRQEAYNRFNQLNLGKQFQGEVLSRMHDGSFVVKVADAGLRMQLPAGAQVGDVLDLTLNAVHPRLTFLLGAQARDANTSLSSAGKLIDNVLQAAQKDGAPTALIGKTPLMPSPAVTTTQAAAALKDTLAFSGLFYESHVRQWANGERSLVDLLREPQARNSNVPLIAAALRAGLAAAAPPPGDAPDQSAAPKTPGHDTEFARIIMNVREWADGGRALLELLRQPAPSGNRLPANLPAATAVADDAPGKPSAETASSPGLSTEHTTARSEGMSGESVRMISLQLDALEQRRVAWQGELWPGQPMKWEVTEHSPRSQAGEVERSWESALRVELPKLGAVSATIVLRGDRLQVQLRAAEDGAATSLRAHGKELAAALDAAGSPLDLLTVKRDDAA